MERMAYDIFNKMAKELHKPGSEIVFTQNNTEWQKKSNVFDLFNHEDNRYVLNPIIIGFDKESKDKILEKFLSWDKNQLEEIVVIGSVEENSTIIPKIVNKEHFLFSDEEYFDSDKELVINEKIMGYLKGYVERLDKLRDGKKRALIIDVSNSEMLKYLLSFLRIIRKYSLAMILVCGPYSIPLEYRIIYDHVGRIFFLSSEKKIRDAYISSLESDHLLAKTHAPFVKELSNLKKGTALVCSLGREYELIDLQN